MHFDKLCKEPCELNIEPMDVSASPDIEDVSTQRRIVINNFGAVDDCAFVAEILQMLDIEFMGVANGLRVPERNSGGSAEEMSIKLLVVFPEGLLATSSQSVDNDIHVALIGIVLSCRWAEIPDLERWRKILFVICGLPSVRRHFAVIAIVCAGDGEIL